MILTDTAELFLQGYSNVSVLPQLLDQRDGMNILNLHLKSGLLHFQV